MRIVLIITVINAPRNSISNAIYDMAYTHVHRQDRALKINKRKQLRALSTHPLLVKNYSKNCHSTKYTSSSAEKESWVNPVSINNNNNEQN